ncbi:sensor histidine kinase [Micromonospora echinospora]|uniref:sensor histidine kinase n=1 Tax=Micromonospora echinospora TaxID=1877 RepID=UPI00366A9962
MRVRAWLGRQQERLLDLVLAAVIGVAAVQSEHADVVRAVAVTGVCVAAILVRRYRPVPALLTVTAAALVAVVARAPSSSVLIVTVGVLVYAAALHTVRRRPWTYALGVAGTLAGAGLITDFGFWWKPDSLTLLVWVCGGAAFGDAIRSRRAYVAEVTERARQAEQTREEEARRRVMDERLRIARDLHDIVAHHIAVINVQAGAAGHVVARHPEQAGPVLELIRQASDTVLREIKSVIAVLREPGEPPGTAPSPGLAQVPDLLAGLTGIGFHVRAHEHGETRQLPAITDLTAYRIVQEALTNAHRYGDGTADLTITHTPAAVTIEVVNRVGPPRPDRPAGSGFGLVGMRERAAAAHGTVIAGPAADGRFRVHVTLPVDPTPPSPATRAPEGTPVP